ncbi:phage P22, antirepressor protein [Methylobacterium terrae]|uniref:Phage P22, antirepressor protein n=1 Tax=Methylobacterium terrae TaxID=2202827 RepID=A0A2U8WPL3_9HYPH|nr:phage antirepressor N-terminal domain-containing protein [Methylobacterium terrae]AWN47142.1 phage P22, antirepressor protein [Methylobacterium terrae]
MMGQIITVTFRGAELYGFRRDDAVFVALKPIVQAMGLDWSAQFRRLKRDPILSEGIAVMATPFGPGGTQEATCLRLDLLHGWFFTIDTSRIPDDATRESVQAYQREAYDVLHSAFTGGARPVPLASPAEAREPVPQALAVAMVTEARRTFGTRASGRLWRHLGLPWVDGMGEPPAQGVLPLGGAR